MTHTPRSGGRSGFVGNPSTERHTPGPWTVSEYMDDGRLGVLSDDNEILCAVSVGLRPADAHLIATSPDLLALAKRYASECADCGGTGIADTWEDNVPGDITKGVHAATMDCPECADIRAVIAKAEGR